MSIPSISAQLDDVVSNSVDFATREVLEKQRGSRVIEDRTIDALTRNSETLQKRYPRGGVSASRILTAPIVISSPEGYFNKYEDIVHHISNITQSIIANESTQADVDSITQARDNPTDDHYQEGAFTVVTRAIRRSFEETDRVLQYSPIERSLISQMVFNEIVGFGPLDPFWREKGITEIFVNGPDDIQFEYKGVVRPAKSIRFRDQRHLENLIDNLYSAIGRTVSAVNPLRPGRLPDLSRMTAIHKSVSPEGPNLAIRRHPEEYWTPKDLIEFNSANEEMLTELGNFIHKGCSFIVSGGTSTGKTSFLNALTGFYRDDQRLLLLEDNLEMKPNPKKLWAPAMEANLDINERGEKIGVSMRDLVQIALRMSPQVIVIGEIRDGAMYDLIQALNTGHSGASTVHTDSAKDAMNRIQALASQASVIREDTIGPMIAAAFDLIIQLERFSDGSRRVTEIAEVLPDMELDDTGNRIVKTNPLWKFKAVGTKGGNIIGDWHKVGEMSKGRVERRRLDVQESLSWEELKELSSVDGITVSEAGNI